MSTIKTHYNRRSFLKISAASGGGMLLGFSFLAGCKADVVAEQIKTKALPKNWFDMNAFLKIGENGLVTILSPNPEIGQNVKTSMPMLIAEELDVNWEDVVVEQAGFDKNKYERQVAGGSQSIRHGWTSLRTAGATARRMLLEAAAQKLEVPVDELRTENGIISHKNSDKTISYGEVASVASQIEIPEEVQLKDPKDFKIIGQGIKNVDGQKIVTGQPLFGLDYKEEGMLIAMIEHPPAFGMKLKSVDDSKAKTMSGIKGVYTIDTSSLSEQRPTIFAFSEVVAVVGNSTWEVLQAKKALNIEWEKANTLEDSATHSQEMDKFLANKNIEAKRKDGNPSKAFKDASKIIERVYTAPFLAHNTLEPMNFFADVSSEKADLVGPIQTPQWASGMVADALGMDVENVSIDMTRQGGGFGRRLYGHFVVEAALISKAAQSPIKLIYTREDDMSYGVYRPAYKVKYRAAINDKNEMTAFHVSGVGAHGGPVWENRFPAGAVEHYLAEDQSIETVVSTGAWRAPKSNFIAGAEQAFLDEVAEAIGKDPIDFRLELFEKAKANPVGEENDYDAERYAGVLKMVREKSGWDNQKSGVHRGVAAYYCHNSYVAQVVDIIEKNGKPAIQKVWSAVDCGIVVNPEGAKNQIEGGLIDGIGHAMYSAMSFKDGVPQQKNFNTYNLIRHMDAPMEIETHFVDNGIDPTGLGEPGLPPVMGALANALYKATGKRFYDQPFAQNKELLG